MIASLHGTIAAISAGAVVVEVGGIGYLVQVPVSVVAEASVGEKLSLLTYLAVREDAMTLYGFESAAQKQQFLLLTGVNGVGPKLAMAIVSSFEPEVFAAAISSRDVAALTSVSGVGKRSAERIILDLTPHFESTGSSLAVAPPAVAEVREALAAMGYTPGELRGVVEKAAAAGGDVEDMVRLALKELARA